MKCLRIAMTATLIWVLAITGVVTAETIVLRSGQVNGIPGTDGQLDDLVKYGAVSPPATEMSNSPFNAADFNAANTHRTAALQA